MRRIALMVDLSNHAYRAAAAHSGLTCGRVFTGGLYGFLVTLAKMIRETAATEVWVTEDIKPYRRSELYPEYKLLRKKSQDDDLLKAFKQSLPMIQEGLDILGIPRVGVPGFESDDCIGSLVQDHHHRFHRMYAGSNDSDLFQLLRFEQFRVLKGSELSTVVDITRLSAGPMPLTIDQFMLAQALQGTHNDVAGIPRVGPVTAYKIVTTPALLRQAMEQHGPLIERNLMLSKLPHPDFPGLRIPKMGKFNARTLYRFCARFDIEVTKSMIDSFEQISHD